MPVWQTQKQFITQILAKQQDLLLGAGWTEVEGFTRKGPEVFIGTVGIGTGNSCQAFFIVSACACKGAI